MKQKIDISFEDDIKDDAKNWQFELVNISSQHISAAAIYCEKLNNKRIHKYRMSDDMESYVEITTT